MLYVSLHVILFWLSLSFLYPLFVVHNLCISAINHKRPTYFQELRKSTLTLLRPDMELRNWSSHVDKLRLNDSELWSRPVDIQDVYRYSHALLVTIVFVVIILCVLDNSCDTCIHIFQVTLIGSEVTLGRGLPPFVEFSLSIICDIAKVPYARFFEAHSYLAGIAADELRWHLSNINVIFDI